MLQTELYTPTGAKEIFIHMLKIYKSWKEKKREKREENV